MKRLSEVLAELYPIEESAHRIVDEAGLSRDQIPFRGSAFDWWHQILVEANHRQGVGTLVEIAAKENPERAAELEDARLEDLRRRVEPPSESAPEDRVGSPTSEAGRHAEQAPPAAEPATDRTTRLGTIGLILGLPVALMTLTAGVLDLPGKWADFRQHTASESQPLQLLTGRLLDAETGRPLVGVRVQLPEHGEEKTTDASGVFTFQLPVASEAMVRVSASLQGYEILEREVSVGPGQNIWRMRRSPQGGMKRHSSASELTAQETR